MAPPRHVFHVFASGLLWEEVPVVPGRRAGGLRFIAPFDGQRAGLEEARRRASVVAPATIYLISVDGTRSEVIHIGDSA